MTEDQLNYFYRELVHGVLSKLENDDWQHLKGQELEEGKSCQTTGTTKIRRD